MKRSLLIGNGVDIQLGGDDCLNKWLIVRLLSDAKAGKYNELFMAEADSSPAITGDELVSLFMEMPSLGNKARSGGFDSLIDKTIEPEISFALEDFKNKYDWEIKSPEQIGIEDWLLLLRLFLQEQSDLLPLFSSIKQGFERIIIDAIYCNGVIQQLYKNAGKNAKKFFSEFDSLFTLNYDSNLEKLSGKSVFHLHGDFETVALSENPETAYGFLRNQKGETVYFPQKFKHCNCNAILDYSGDNKYKFAVALSAASQEFEKLKFSYENKREEFEEFVSRLPTQQQEIIRVGMEQNLQFGYNYHFHDLEQLTGELAIIGIAPQNDSHLFQCINKSNLDRVIFYHLFSPDDKRTPVLLVEKLYEVKDVGELWATIGLQTPQYTSPTAKNFQLRMLRNGAKIQKFVNVFNAFESEANAVDASEILRQLKSIPKETEKSIIKMMMSEMQKEKYRSSPVSEEALYKQFRGFGRTLVTSSLSPQTLYFLYISNIQHDKLKTSSKHKKKKK